MHYAELLAVDPQFENAHFTNLKKFFTIRDFLRILKQPTNFIILYFINDNTTPLFVQIATISQFNHVVIALTQCSGYQTQSNDIILKYFIHSTFSIRKEAKP